MYVSITEPVRALVLRACVRRGWWALELVFLTRPRIRQERVDLALQLAFVRSVGSERVWTRPTAIRSEKEGRDKHNGYGGKEEKRLRRRPGSNVNSATPVYVVKLRCCV